jgi:hypothetical protein
MPPVPLPPPPVVSLGFAFVPAQAAAASAHVNTNNACRERGISLHWLSAEQKKARDPARSRAFLFRV